MSNYFILRFFDPQAIEVIECPTLEDVMNEYEDGDVVTKEIPIVLVPAE